QEDLRAFYDLFVDTSRRQEFFGEPYGFFLNLGATLFPKRHAALFLAEWQGTVLAACLVVFYGRRATYLYGGSSPHHRNVMPCYAMHLAAIDEARRRGCSEYDFWGIDPFGQPDHLYAGFSQFKRQWGGTVVSSLGAHDLLFYDRLADHIFHRLTAEPAA
ncbi:MAG: peptidoglycan bridge formation glycyltransferase FemA/FemB family protein, partial [Armatimonadota bacterium]